MKLLGILLVAGALAAGACGKDAKKDKETASEAETPAAEPTADGKRKLAIEVGKTGYQPDSLTARGGEEVVLEFTRVADTECGRYIKVADGEQIELPMNEPVEVPLTMPADGEIRFACGMDMFTGVVTVAAN